jgi:hypothetical protein
VDKVGLALAGRSQRRGVSGSSHFGGKAWYNPKFKHETGDAPYGKQQQHDDNNHTSSNFSDEYDTKDEGNNFKDDTFEHTRLTTSHSLHLRTLELHTSKKPPTLVEIKGAYRRLALQHHPDLGGERDAFDLIVGAYDALIADVDGTQEQSSPAPNSRQKDNQSQSPPPPEGLANTLNHFARNGEYDNVWQLWGRLVEMSVPVIPRVFGSLTLAAYQEGGDVPRARACIADAIKHGMIKGEEAHIAAWNAHLDELARLQCPIDHAMEAIDAMETLGIKPSLEVMYNAFGGYLGGVS